MKTIIPLMIVLSFGAQAADFSMHVEQCSIGHPQYCFKLAEKYYLGQGVTKDFNLAFEYANKACELGSALGCLRLGTLYENGNGVLADLEKA